MTPDERLDSATRARMAAKDMLRGLRHELERLKSSRPTTGLMAPLPAEALQGLFKTVDKIASAGEHLARDLLFSNRDQSRYADFFDPRSALVDDPDAGHRFVRSRYAALKLIASHLVAEPVLISESKIAKALSSLPHTETEEPIGFEAQFTITLADAMAISCDGIAEAKALDLNRLASLVIGLAGVVASREAGRDARDLPDLIALCIDIVKLKEARLLPIFEGPAPTTILAAVYDELADALKDF